MNLDRYEILKKVVDAIKSTHPFEIRINDYSSQLEITFTFKDRKNENPKAD